MPDVNACYYRENKHTNSHHFLQLYDAGRVQRFHTTPDYSGAPRQSLAEHQWGVALICRELCQRLGEPCRGGLYAAALTHDLAEYWTCDMPAHIKWAHPALQEPLDEAQISIEVSRGIRSAEWLTPEEKRLLKWADGIELYTYSRQRARAGSTAYRSIADNIYDHLVNSSTYTEAVDRLAATMLGELREELK